MSISTADYSGATRVVRNVDAPVVFAVNVVGFAGHFGPILQREVRSSKWE